MCVSWTGRLIASNGLSIVETNSLIAEHNGSTPLIPKPTTAHDPEPVPSTSHPHSLFP